MPTKSSKIKVVDINDTMETITETVDNQVETVDIPIVEDEIKLLPKTRAKAKAKPKLPVEDELINDIEELPKPKAKSKSRAKPKVNDVVYDDIEVEELPQPKAKAKPKAKKEIVKLEEVPEEEIKQVKTKNEPKQECPDCHKMIAAKSLKYDYHKCITKKIKAFKAEHPEEEIKNEEIKTEAVINDDVVVNEFQPSITHKTTTVVMPKPTRAALRKERMKDLFVEAV